MRVLAGRLKKHRLTPDSEDGFILQRVRDQSVEGTYFEKIAIDEVIRDPFGNETKYERITYREVEFVFSSEYPEVELRKFPRALHGFLSRMLEVADFAVSFVPLSIDTLVWANGVQRTYPKAFRLDLAQLSEVFLEDGVTAQIVLASREDLRGAYQRFTANRKHVVEKVQVRIEHEGRLVGLQLSADGTVRTTDALTAAMLEDLKRALPRRKLA